MTQLANYQSIWQFKATQPFVDWFLRESISYSWCTFIQTCSPLFGKKWDIKGSRGRVVAATEGRQISFLRLINYAMNKKSPLKANWAIRLTFFPLLCCRYVLKKGQSRIEVLLHQYEKSHLWTCNKGRIHLKQKKVFTLCHWRLISKASGHFCSEFWIVLKIISVDFIQMNLAIVCRQTNEGRNYT